MFALLGFVMPERVVGRGGESLSVVFALFVFVASNTLWRPR